MSNQQQQQQQQRRTQQPQQQHYYPQQTAAYGQDPSYAQYGAAPSWQAAQHQQTQLYYPNQQQYPSADPYGGYANHTQATSSPYPQISHYSPAQQQSYAPQGTVYLPNAYPQNSYLAAADYSIQGGSPNHFSPGSVSSGPSPRVASAGRSRLQNFVFPNQQQQQQQQHGVSPSLESQVANLSLTASLPNKPVSGAVPMSRPGSNMRTAPPTTTEGLGERSDISLRYPPLPTVSERPVTPPALRSEETKEAAGAKVDSDVAIYISSLRTIIETYRKRDELLRLRTEAVGFQPKPAYLAWQSSTTANTAANGDEAEPSVNPILGVRLLQRLDTLQRENDELGRLLSARTTSKSRSDGEAKEVAELRKEVEDSHKLIVAMDEALSSAEARAKASERALEVACRTNSTAIISGAGKTSEAVESTAANQASGGVEEKKVPPKSTATRGGRGGGRSGSQQQRGKLDGLKRDEAAASTAKAVPAGGGGGGGGEGGASHGAKTARLSTRTSPVVQATSREERKRYEATQSSLSPRRLSLTRLRLVRLVKGRPVEHDESPIHMKRSLVSFAHSHRPLFAHAIQARYFFLTLLYDVLLPSI